MQLQRKHARIALKIAVARQNRPFSTDRDRTDQEIYGRSREARGTAIVTDRRGAFIVVCVDWLVGENAEQIPEFLKLRTLANSTQNFLANGPDDFGAAFFEEFAQFRCSSDLMRIQYSGPAA